MHWLGLDVGGAHLKLADGRGNAWRAALPLWKQPDRLAPALRELLSAAGRADAIALTMTGELADCFTTKRQGVSQICDAVKEAAGRTPLRVYGTDGAWRDVDAAKAAPSLIAAANWHALARFAGRFAPSQIALLIDIGSTTSDLIPLVNGRPTPEGATDTQRLISGELVYTGVWRTPLCAVAPTVPYRDAQCPTAAERFATTADAWLTLGDLPEDAENTETADGRPATREAALDRLARSICADRESFDSDDARAVAEALGRGQLSKLGVAAQAVLRRLPDRPATAVVSGAGEFLARRLIEKLRLDCPLVSLAEELGAEVSHSATAHALAVLAEESP